MEIIATLAWQYRQISTQPKTNKVHMWHLPTIWAHMTQPLQIMQEESFKVGVRQNTNNAWRIT
eukprot:9239868-Ditylum_brightwellii.AAC.1